jgi:hemolysin activation/secretion protein
MDSFLTEPQSRAMRRWHLPAAMAVALGAWGFTAAAEDPVPPPDVQTAPPSAVPSEDSAEASAPAAAPPKADEHSQFHGSFELDNQHSVDTDPLRATLALSYTNLFSKPDELSALYQVAPQDAKQVSAFVTSYVSNPLPWGLQPSVYFIDSSTDVPNADTAGVLGKGQTLGFRLSHALSAAAPQTAQSLTLGLEYKHYRNTLATDDSSSAGTPISYLNLSLAYASTWSTAQREAAVTISANYGPHGGANAADAYADDDFRAGSNYFYVRADGEFVTSLPKGFRLYLRLAGQYTGDSLNINEDYPIAGIDGVRGYLEAEVLGDRALKGTMQLQSPAWQHGTRQVADAFIFFDAGVAEMLENLPGEPMHSHPRSWGLGIGLAPAKGITASLVWARPLVSAITTYADESRILFLVRTSF